MTSTKICKACNKKVVAFKKIKLNGMIWHKNCCRCSWCDLQLSTKTARVDSSGKTYCIRHCPKPSVQGSPTSPVTTAAKTEPRPSTSKEFSSIMRKPQNGKDHQIVTLRDSSYDRICQITPGSICDTPADAIVNSTSVTTDLSIGALSRAVAKAGGPAIQGDLDKQRKEATKPATFGDVVVTTGGNIECKYIFHTILRHWKDGQHVVQDLRQIMKTIFRLADEYRCSSLAIPPIGTGKLGYPKHIVAQVLYAEAADYLDNNTDSSIERIIFVVNGENDLWKIFEKLQLEEQEDEAIYDDVIPAIQMKTEAYYETLDYQYSNSFKQPHNSSPNRESSLLPITYPRNWVLTKNSDKDKPYESVELDPTSDEYRSVISLIVAADGEKYEKFIAKIQRIENGRCYELYEYLKRMMIEKNTPDVMNERHLFHGTSASAKDNIVATGFNRNYAGARAPILYGRGVYFASNFSYSAQPQYSPPDRDYGMKHIFLCRVLTGMTCLGHRTMLEPDYLPDRSRQYDSAVDDLGNPKIFVVFKDYVAYPEYLISFYEDSTDYANV